MDRTGCVEIKADWSNGMVAMSGCSYGGTLPFEVATTGVEGLETIIPSAGIASWYDYTNAQGAPTIFEVSYANALAAFNCGGTFLDESFEKLDMDKDADAVDYDYSCIVDNQSITVKIPVSE